MANEIVARDEARAQGLKRYFDGSCCANGHIAERYVRDGKCSRCAYERSVKWVKTNLTAAVNKVKRWREANPDAFRDSNRKSKSRNKHIYNARQRKLYAANPEKYKEIWARNYDKHKEYHIQRAKISGSNRRALKKGSGGSHTAADLKAILSAQSHKCAYCRTDLRKAKRHLDHIMPLALGGSNDRTNLQYLCAGCNLSKGAKHPIAFAQELGRLL